MRRIAIAGALMLLAGCQKSFDDRYADAEKKLRGEASSIDKELADRASEAAMAPVVLPSPGAQAQGQAAEQASDSSPRPSARNSPGK